MKIIRKEQISLENIRTRFFDEALAELIKKYLVDNRKEFMTLQATLCTLVGAAAGDLCPSEEELHQFMETIGAIITSQASYTFEKKGKQSSDETPTQLH